MLNRFGNLVKDAKKAAASWGEDTTDIVQLNQKRKSIYDDWYSESTNVNKNVHYREDEWENFRPEELQKVVKAYKALHDLVRCSNCGSFARVLFTDRKPVQLVCHCRKSFDWSLEKNKG